MAAVRVPAGSICSACFFFGTLIHPAVLHRVIGHSGANTTTVDADLPGFTRHHIKHVDYPAIVPAGDGERIMGRKLTEDEATVRGRLVTGLSAQDIRALDIFEGDVRSAIERLIDARRSTAGR